VTGYYLIGAIITTVAIVLAAWRSLTPTGRHRAPRATASGARQDWLEVDE
jgi:hypothetical protein